MADTTKPKGAIMEYFRIDNYEVYCEKHLPTDFSSVIDRLSDADQELQEEGNVDNWGVYNACHVCCEFDRMHSFCSEICHENWSSENGIDFVAHIPHPEYLGEHCTHCYERIS